MPTAHLDLPPDPDATTELGAWLGGRLPAGSILGLIGELGSGKTTLVRGLARGLGVEDPEAVSSPTYLLVIEHPGPVPLRHADAYLPAKLEAFLDDGGLDYLLDGSAVVAIEWADRVATLLPESTLWAELVVGPDLGREVRFRWAEGAGFPFLADLPMIGRKD